MIIIDKSKPLPPIYVRTPVPLFRTDYEKKKYYDENKRRCLEGFGELPGTLYDYLQNQKIKHRLTPKGHDPVEPPEPRISSLWIHEELNKTRNQNKFQGIIKARGVGLSTEFGALANYFVKYYPGSNSLITSKDQDGIATLFLEKIYTPYQHLHPDLRPDELQKNQTKQRCYLRLGVNHIGNDGNEQYSESQINLRETSETPDSPTNFSGQGAIYGFCDEAPLHKRREALFRSIVECFRDPSTKKLEGTLVWGGTCEDTMSNESVSELQRLVADKDLWDCNILFIPYWWNAFLTNGHPDQKKSEEWWNREYEKAEKDSAKARAFIRNNPRTIEDIFESVRGGRWEDETAEILTLQKNAILNADIPCAKYTITGMGNDTVVQKDNKGSFWMIEEVKQNCLYMVGIDGIATGTELGSTDGSKMASVVTKTLDPHGDQYTSVNIYEERPKTVEAGYRKILVQMNHYNKFGGLRIIAPEANASTIETFSTFLLKEAPHFFKLLAKRKDLSGKGFSDTKKLGQYRTPEIIKFQYDMANVFIRKYYHSIQMLPLIEAMLTGVTVDSHILDAWLQFFTAMPEYDKIQKAPPPPRRRTVRTIEFIGGKSVFKDVEV